MFPHKAVCVILIARVLLNLQLMAMPSAISKIVFEYIIPGAGRRRRPVVDLYKTIGFLTRHRCRCRRRLGHRMHQYESLKGRIYVTSRREDVVEDFYWEDGKDVTGRHCKVAYKGVEKSVRAQCC
jgi:hypothetical protein